MPDTFKLLTVNVDGCIKSLIYDNNVAHVAFKLSMFYLLKDDLNSNIKNGCGCCI